MNLKQCFKHRQSQASGCYCKSHLVVALMLAILLDTSLLARLAMLMNAPTLSWTCTSTGRGWLVLLLFSTSRPSSPPPSAEVLSEVKEDYLRRANLLMHPQEAAGHHQELERAVAAKLKISFIPSNFYFRQ